MNFEELLKAIKQTHFKFNSKAVAQVNFYNTLRNWLIGHHIVEFEQFGEDRATYGKVVLKNLAEKLGHIRGMSMTNLKLFRLFYQVYPEIGQTISDNLNQVGLPAISQTPSDQLSQRSPEYYLSTQELLTQLSFSHFIELIRVDNIVKRQFYEMEAIKNAWTVRALARAIDTLLFERTGLSTHKADVIAKISNNRKIQVADVIKNPYLLEFLGLEEKPEYTEHDLESAIIDHLQHFLTEMGRVFVLRQDKNVSRLITYITA